MKLFLIGFIFGLVLVEVSSLKCYEGTWDSGNWTTPQTNKTCTGSQEFWCKKERHYDSKKDTDKRIYTCATNEQCKDAIKVNNAADKTKDDSSGFNQFSSVTADYDLCCGSDLCNENNSALSLQIAQSMLFFVSIYAFLKTF